MASTTSQSSDEKKRNGRNRLLFVGGAIVLLILILAVLFGDSLLGRSEAGVSEDTAVTVTLPSSGPPPVVGDLAQEFTLQNVDGEMVSLSQHLGNPIIINFWASWCAPCRVEMPALQALHDAHQDTGLVILMLNLQESPEVASDFFFEDMGLTFANPLLDEDGTVARQYGVRNLPTTFFINEVGGVTAVHRGPAVQAQFEAYLQETIAN